MKTAMDCSIFVGRADKNITLGYNGHSEAMMICFVKNVRRRTIPPIRYEV